MSDDPTRYNITTVVTLKEIYDRTVVVESKIKHSWWILTGIILLALSTFGVTKWYLLPEAVRTAIERVANLQAIEQAKAKAEESSKSAKTASAEATKIIGDLNLDLENERTEWKKLVAQLNETNIKMLKAIEESAISVKAAKNEMIAIADMNQSEMYEVSMLMTKLREAPARPYESEEIATKLANVAGYRFGIFTLDHKLLMIGKGDQYGVSEVKVRKPILDFKVKIEQELERRRNGAPHNEP